MRGNPDFKQDAIVQNFAQLEGKKTIEIAAQQSLLSDLPQDFAEGLGKRTDEILELRQDFAEVKGKESVHEKTA